MKDRLTQIKSPKDIKKLNFDQLKSLSDEIRKYLIETVSETGGHLSSNLGVVELTLGLHKVFDTPTDKIVWDVGHQSYVHKILTGRYDQMKTIRQYKGLSGFPKTSESVHDAFDVGHSSTSISVALGMAVARDMKNEKNSVIAVIGDGAMTAGMAYEALNNGANIESNFIVILNDNQMSISKNVGGMALYLDSIRTGEIYNEIKNESKRFLHRIPVVGDGMIRVAHGLKSGLKQIMIPGMLFEELGYKYLGPIDGHDIAQITTTLTQAKKIQGPVLIHMKTTKGKGYTHAEVNPTKFHGTKPFITHTGEALGDSVDKSLSDVMGESLVELAMNNDKIVAITAAMPEGTGLSQFAKRYPKRFFDVGIAEQHAVTFAAGLAISGLRPLVAIYSTFLQRAYDQLVHDVCIQKLPVVFAIDRAGIVGEDGETHQGIFDLSYLSHLPNMTVIAPSDGYELKAAMTFAMSYSSGPVAIRFPKGVHQEKDNQNDEVFHYGQSRYLQQGEKIAIVSVGSMKSLAAALIKEYENKGYHPTWVDLRFVKPLDEALFETLFESYEGVVILEENTLKGGVSSEVSRLKAIKQWQTPLFGFGLADKFIPHGCRDQLLIDAGLTVEEITRQLPWQ